MLQVSTDAQHLFSQGYACSQAVVGVFCEKYGLSRELAFRLSSSFGGGMKRAEICGAVSGALLVVGLKHGFSKPGSRRAKQLCNTHTDEFLCLFVQQHRHLSCRDLLGCDITTQEGIAHAEKAQLFSSRCVDFVTSAAQLLHNLGY